MYKRKSKRIGPSLDDIKGRGRGTGKSPLTIILTEWEPIYLVFSKNGKDDFGVLVVLALNILWFIYQPAPGATVKLAWPIIIALYVTPFLTFFTGLQDWIFPGFARARAVTARHAEESPWYKCIVSPAFMAVYALVIGMGGGIMLLGLYQALVTWPIQGTLLAGIIADILATFGVL